MHPKIKITVQIAALCLIGFIGIQIFNSFCSLNSNCTPFYFSRYFPKTEGDQPIIIAFESKNYIDGIEFVPYTPSITTVINRVNSVKYVARNTSNHLITFKAFIESDPDDFAKSLTLYKCLCSHEITIKKGEEITLPIEFLVKNDEEVEYSIRKYKDLDSPYKVFKIRYRLTETTKY